MHQSYGSRIVIKFANCYLNAPMIHSSIDGQTQTHVCIYKKIMIIQ